MAACTQKLVFQEALEHFHAAIADEVTELLLSYESLEANDTSLPPQVFRTASVLHTQYPEVFSEQQLVLLVAQEWQRIQTRYESEVLVQDLCRRETPSWRTIEEAGCPFCDHVQLSIAPGTDGKQVECGQCDEVFDLDLLGV